MGKVFQMAPCIMRCKPTQHDRWERRIIELAAYLFRNGHANVPEASSRLLPVTPAIVEAPSPRTLYTWPGMHHCVPGHVSHSHMCSCLCVW